MRGRYEVGVAFRYVWMAGKRRHTAFLTIISTLGLAVGVATLLISLSLLSGLQGQIKGRLIASTPQILIEPVGASGIVSAAQIQQILAATPDAKVQSVITGIAWASDRSGHHGRPVRIRSYQEGEAPEADASFGRRWEADAGTLDPIYLTRDFANAVGLFLRDEIVVVSPRQRLTPFGPVPIHKTYRIARILPATQDQNAPEARLPFEETSRLFATAGNPTAIEVYTSLSRAARIVEDLQSRNLPVIIRDWEEINKPLFLALRLEKIVMFATISLIIFVAALNLVSSVAMLIVEKRPQVGVLRTLGASEKSILAIFLSVGLLIGLGGTLLGNIIGLGVSWAAERFQLIPLPSEVYALAHLPFQIELREVIGVNLIAIVLSILATWYPARLAAKLDPITAIRSGE